MIEIFFKARKTNSLRNISVLFSFSYYIESNVYLKARAVDSFSLYLIYTLNYQFIFP